jgi:acyl-CoA thioesterase I
VAIGNVPDLSQVPAYGGLDPALVRQTVAQWNAIIARQAARHSATVVDIHAHWQDLAAHPEYVGVDGFHPSAEGYQRLAAIFFGALQAGGLV